MDEAIDRLDPHDIAERLRALIGPRDRDELAAVARSMLVGEADLRASLEGSRREPNIAVLAAVVRAYGVDPTWLLTGSYSSATHHVALDESSTSLDALIRLIARRVSPAAASALRIEDLPSDL